MSNEKKVPKLGIRDRFRHISTFWQHFSMMTCVLLMAISAFAVSNQVAENALTQRSLEQIELDFTHNCSEIAVSMYSSVNLIQSTESSYNYHYIRNERSGTMDKRYAFVVSRLSDAFREESILLGDDPQFIMYLPNINCLFTSDRTYFTAQNCFDSHITFSSLTAREVMELLRTKKTVQFIPQQLVTTNGGQPRECIGLILWPYNAAVSVMSLYPTDYLLSRIRIPSLPDGSCLRITDNNGVTIFEHLGGDGSAMKDGFVLDAPMDAIQAHATLWIPKDYFASVHDPAMALGLLLLGLAALCGLTLCLVFSNISTRPIRRIISQHGDDLPQGNEYAHLQALLDRTKSDTAAMQRQLAQSLLTRALSGAVLTEPDLAHLRSILDPLPDHYRVAVLCVSQEVGVPLSLNLLPGFLPEEFSVHPINSTECGVFFPDSEENTALLEDAVKRLSEQLITQNIRVVCGVSTRSEELGGFHVAVRQARIAIQRNQEFSEYSTGGHMPVAVTWPHYEGMYQKITSNDEEGALAQLQRIAAEYHEGPETFYSVRFMLRNAAEEIGLPFQEAEVVRYNPALSTEQNTMNLESMLTQMFSRVREKQEQRRSDWQDELQRYLQEHYCDLDITTLSCAAKFVQSEKRVYTAVRQLTGMSFNQYIVCLRMEKARRMLLNTQEGVNVISEKCGYQAVNSFYRIFKKHYGVAPAEFRRCGGRVEIPPTPLEDEDPEV